MGNTTMNMQDLLASLFSGRPPKAERPAFVTDADEAKVRELLTDWLAIDEEELNLKHKHREHAQRLAKANVQDGTPEAEEFKQSAIQGNEHMKALYLKHNEKYPLLCPIERAFHSVVKTAPILNFATVAPSAEIVERRARVAIVGLLMVITPIPYKGGTRQDLRRVTREFSLSLTDLTWDAEDNDHKRHGEFVEKALQVYVNEINKLPDPEVRSDGMSMIEGVFESVERIKSEDMEAMNAWAASVATDMREKLYPNSHAFDHRRVREEPTGASMQYVLHQ